MSKQLKFNRKYAEFDNSVRDFEKSYDVGIEITKLLWFQDNPFYPIASIVDSHISAIWLGEGESGDEETIDLIFRMGSLDSTVEDRFLYEVILRTADGPVYGGWLFGGKLTVTDEIVSGHRVIETDVDGSTARFVYQLSTGQYSYVEESLGNVSTFTARTIGKLKH